MSATKFFNAGYTDLVPVIPPDVKLSPNSSISPKSRGKVPGKLGREGNWYGFSGWQTSRADPRHPGQWERWGANVGLRGDRFPGVDIDVEDETLAKVVLKFAKEHLGPTYVRLSRDPRRLLVYRSVGAIPYTALDIEYRGVTHTVEVLGRGRQYLVHGTHPSGAKYRWVADRAPYSGIDPVPYITADAIQEFFTAIQTGLATKGIKSVVRGRTSPEGPTPPQEELIAPSDDELSRVVRLIPNTTALFPTRDDYVAFGCAVKAAGGGGDDGFDAFLEWTGRWDEGVNDPGVVASDWARMHAPFRMGWEWLRRQAGDTAQDDFEADPTLKAPPPQVRYSDEYFVAKLMDDVQAKLKYVPSEDTGTWMTWQDYRWVEDSLLEHERTVRGFLYPMALDIQHRALPLSKTEGKEHRIAAKYIQSNSGVRALIRMFRARLTCLVNEFDVDPWVLNTPGGVVDLRTGQRRPIVPGEMFARATAVTPAVRYDAVKAPRWRKFLAELCGDDAELSEFLARYAGYALTGDMSEKVFVFAWGSNSDTGKSTFIKTITGVMADYARSVQVTAFASAEGGRVPDDIAQLPGVRLVTATEPAAGMQWDDHMIKAVTGDDEIQARRFFKSWFNFQPQFKILVAGNHEPELRQVDDAMRRRLLIIPMNHKVPREEQTPNLHRIMIEEEGEQILAWAVEGCLRWQKDGIPPSEAIRGATDDYWAVEDALARWIEDECDLGAGFEESRADLYHSWKGWRKSRNVKRTGGDTSFKREMDSRKEEFGFEDGRVGPQKARKRGYHGIRLKGDFEI